MSDEAKLRALWTPDPVLAEQLAVVFPEGLAWAHDRPIPTHWDDMLAWFAARGGMVTPIQPTDPEAIENLTRCAEVEIDHMLVYLREIDRRSSYYDMSCYIDMLPPTADPVALAERYRAEAPGRVIVKGERVGETPEDEEPILWVASWVIWMGEGPEHEETYLIELLDFACRVQRETSMLYLAPPVPPRAAPLSESRHDKEQE
jgi:hypothetical protein